MLRLVYMSSATQGVTRRDLAEISRISVRNNQRDGISGMLLHIEGSFLQVLEGEKHIVEQAFDRISKDPRHCRVTVVERAESDRRDFPDWAMGCFDVDARAMPADVPVMSAAPANIADRLGASSLKTLRMFLQIFYASHRIDSEFA